MALMFSGNPAVVVSLKKLGITPEYAMGNWLGPWTNQAQIDGHIAWCKANGVKPAFQFFYWGDEICVEALEGTFQPREYGGAAESVGAYWALAKLLTDRLKATKTEGALISIESEWNKLGPNLPKDRGLTPVTSRPEVWDKVFADTAGLFHTAPGTLVATCPGSWHDLAALLAQYPRMVAAADIVATQGLNTLYKRSEAAYIAGADKFLTKVQELKVGGKGKPIMIMDTAWSSYSGSYVQAGDSKVHHYAPIPPATAESNLRAGEAAQAKAIGRLAELLPRLEAAGLKGVFYRGLHDTRMDIKNYWGYFEWGWGVVRLDGTKKPSFDALMACAGAARPTPAPAPAPAPAPPPAPRTYTEAEYRAAVDRALAAEKRAVAAESAVAQERQLAAELARRSDVAQAVLRGERLG